MANQPVLISAENSPLKSIQRRCARIAVSEATVLVLGETGTGKEVMARQVHTLSGRRNGPFVPVNCGAIPETLLESELFGYVKGAFTGASQNRRGRIAMSDAGTLFLDEIGELPLSLQVKLLRVLQDRSYEPVGSNQSVPADFRLIAATNRDLAREVEAGRFRQDLYYRLLVCPVKLPPLRDRVEDIVPLFDYFWKARGETRPVEPNALAWLKTQSWPGNVRELENFVERLSVCNEGDRIDLAGMEANFGTDDPLDRSDRVLPEAARPLVPQAQPVGVPSPATLVPTLPIDLPAYIRELEDKFISAALEQTSGNRRAAADLLGLQRTTLVEKLRRRTARKQDAESLEPTAS